jgi:sodium/hydrogen exchanger-like protein 6/7
MSYSTFLASEAFGLTGVVSVLFCGIFQAHYTYNNLSKQSQTQTKEIFNLLNFLSENFIFIYIGISMFTFGNHKWEFVFIFGALIAIVIARFINIYPLSFIINLSRSKKNKITPSMQHLMFYSGLRGAMAYALAMRNTSTQARKLILTTTSIIVIVTVILCGGSTTKMIQWLSINIPDQNSNNNNNLDPNSNQIDETAINENDSFLKKFKKFILSKFSLFKRWHSFDKAFMKPLLTNHVPALTETMPRFCMPVAEMLTTREQEGLRNISNGQNNLDSNDGTSVVNHESQIFNSVGDNLNILSNPFESSELRIQNDKNYNYSSELDVNI